MRAVLTTLAQLHGLGVCHLDVDAAPPNPILRTTQHNPALEPEPEPEPSRATIPRPNVNPSPRPNVDPNPDP